jgi:drug/metabolite transporter (DMT)-like permease
MSHLDASPTDPKDHPPASELREWLAFASCAAIWGSTFYVIRLGTQALPALWGAALRHALACVLLVVLAFAFGGGLPRGKALRAAVQYGLLNMGLSFSLLYWGEKYVSSGLTAVVYAIIPLTSTLFAHAFGLEPLRPMKVGAAVVGLAGVAMIFSAQLRANVPALPFLGIVVAATSASLSGVMLKLGPRQSPFGANAVGAAIGCVVCLAASLSVGEPHPWPTSSRALFPIVYLVLTGSVGAFVLYTWLVQRWSITRVSFIAVIVPVVALVIGSVVGHEPLTGSALIGVTVVFLGLALGIAADGLKR